MCGTEIFFVRLRAHLVHPPTSNYPGLLPNTELYVGWFDLSNENAELILGWGSFGVSTTDYLCLLSFRSLATALLIKYS